MMLFLSVLIMSILAGAEVDLFVPSFPQLQQSFGLTPFQVELTLGVNLTTYCITSLLVGNLGDRYGRKPVIVGGLIIFILGSALCMGAHDFWQLLCGRALQGMGIAGPSVLAYLIIADTYPMYRQQQLMGILNGAITLAMAFAPVVGSYVNLLWNWQANFLLLLVMGLLSLAFCLRYVPNSALKPHIGLGLKEYLPLFRNKIAIRFMVSICFLVIPYWLFIGMSPILYMGALGVPLSHFGFYQGSTSVAFALVSLTSPYFLARYGQKRCFRWGISCVIASSFAILGLVVTGIQHPWLITSALILLSCGAAYPYNILWPLALTVQPDAKGRIAAIIIAARLLLVSIGLQITSYFYQGTFFALGVAMLTSLSIGLVACYYLVRSDDYQKM